MLAVAVLALLTRGLHLDGLADTADGLGPLRGRERALQVMRQSDVGPFGVVTLVLTLLLQIACLAALLRQDGGWLALWTAVVVARLAMSRTGLPGVPVAEGSSLGRAVAGTVSPPWLAGRGRPDHRPRRRSPRPRCAARSRRPCWSAPSRRACWPPSCCTAAPAPGSAA